MPEPSRGRDFVQAGRGTRVLSNKVSIIFVFEFRFSYFLHVSSSLVVGDRIEVRFRAKNPDLYVNSAKLVVTKVVNNVELN
eukprot:snap_masked-scaffold_29-processed-gene-1.37-mRNA-1 protein AED:1.00 eAED:1.00 QI:0/0/0/0/1/1/3/0/80